MQSKDEAYFLIPFFFCLLFLCTYSPCPVDASDVISLHKKSIVSITVNDRNGQEVATSSGFIIEQDGIIATTCSVISGWYQDVQNTMTVAMGGNETFSIDDVLSYNCRKDVAIIKVNAEGLPSIKLARDGRPKKGQDIIIIFYASTGIRKLHGRIIKISEKFFETTVPLTPEMVGSPVLTEKGEVIGIVTQPFKKRTKLSGFISAQEIANQLAQYKKYANRFQTVQTRTSRSQAPAQKLVPEESTTQEAEKPDDFMNHYLIGCDQERRQMYANAIESFKEVIALNPDYGAAYSNLGNVYYKIGRYDEAAESYRQAIRISSGVPSLYTKLGAVLIILGEYTQAIEAFDKAVKINPKNAEAYFNLGIAYLLNGDRTSATNVYKVLKGLDDNRARNLSELLD